MSTRRRRSTSEDEVSELQDPPVIEEEGSADSEEEESEEEKPISKKTNKKTSKKTTNKTTKEQESDEEEEEASEEASEEEEEVKPKSKNVTIEQTKKKTSKAITPARSKSKVKPTSTTSKKQGTYPFDKEFMKSYKTLVEMLNDREYNLSQPGKESLFGYSERIAPDKNGGTKIKKMINITDETQRNLTNEFGGLEHFKLELSHPNPQLNLLIYFIVPSIEAKSATQARKQLPIDQVRTALTAYEESSIPRLILLSSVELATQGEELIRKANQQTVPESPHRYVHFFSLDELAFNWMKSRYQPKNIRVLRDEEQNAVLSSIEIDDNQEDKRFSLPYIADNDPLCLWYGAKQGDLIQVTRKLPITTEYIRHVLPYETLI